jgi:hypothetical protein
MSDDALRSPAASAIADLDAASARIAKILSEFERQLHDLAADVTRLEQRELVWQASMLNELADLDAQSMQ